jgi:hypothetical protein
MGWESIYGHFNFQSIYDEAVESAPPGSALVEVGVFLGRSLAYLARRAIDANKGLRVYGVDTWVTEPGWGGTEWPRVKQLGGAFAAFCHEMMTHAQEELDFVSVLRCSSTEASNLFCDELSPMARFQAPLGHPHMVFIDANHTYPCVRDDISAWSQAVATGGILAGHDFSTEYSGVQQAVRERFGEDGVGFEVRNDSWLVRT